MARYIGKVITPRPASDAFEYLADFSSVREWDPSVVEAESLSEEPRSLGARFRVVTRFLGRDTELIYETVEIHAPHSIVLRAETPALVSLDAITFSAEGDGTAVVYDANLSLKGARRLFELPLRLAFGRLGAAAEKGLARSLGGEVAPPGALAPPGEASR